MVWMKRRPQVVDSRSVNLVLLDALNRPGYRRKTAVTARTLEDGDALKRAGAGVVPRHDVAEGAVEGLTGSSLRR